MEELSLKELKGILDDNELDLGMRQLSVVPARALAKLPRAVNIDFSNNVIVTLPPEFCLLTHITKLDLSNNRIVHLPNDFGKLVNLEHLDLYKNSIEDLPLSFGGLRSLKWLDVKGNPLESELSAVAGDCQDEKECKQAAVRVVKFIRGKANEHERLVNKQKELSKQHDNKTTATGTSSPVKEKTKKKKNKHKDTQPPPPTTHSPAHDSKMRKEVKQSPNRTSTPRKQSNSCLSTVLGLIRKLLVLSVVVGVLGAAVSTFIILDNCTQKAHHWIPSSQPLCDDLSKAVNTRSLPPTLGSNLYKTLSSMSWVYTAKLRELKADMDDGGYTKKAQYYWNIVYSNTWVVARKWYNEKAADYVADAVENVVIAAKMLIVVFSDMAVFIVEKGTTVMVSAGENVVYYMEHRDELLKSVQRWWANMK